MTDSQVTKVYQTFDPGSNLSLWERWPEQPHSTTALKGNAADEVMINRDWYCYHMVGPIMDSQDQIIGQFRIWRCFDFLTGEMFEIDQEGWPFEERFMRLAKALETHSGQTGLIIIAQ